jgi:multiple sugar transport system substrate-binding protein
VTIRWRFPLATCCGPAQGEIGKSVVDEFNATHAGIRLIVEEGTEIDQVKTDLAAGKALDIYGPAGWTEADLLQGSWLDLAPFIQASGYDMSQFDPNLVDMYKTEQGQVSLPFAVFPSVIFYNPALFDRAGLSYPPSSYGDQYQMPDGSKVDWSWETLANVAKLLTIDAKGRNATQPGFDKKNIVQYGFSFGWQDHAEYWASYWQGGSLLQGTPGSYSAKIPEAWKAAWQWYYDGIWGNQPFIPSESVETSADYKWGNVFASGKIAMSIQPSWYLCCLNDLIRTGGKFDFGILPSYQGKVNGRVYEYSFRIFKASQHPQEAFTVLTYLTGLSIEKLISGSEGIPLEDIGAISAHPEYWQESIDTFKTDFPWVKNWNTLLAGTHYPDIPSADYWLPNNLEAIKRLRDFRDLLVNTPNLNLNMEEQALEFDLTEIFNR